MHRGMGWVTQFSCVSWGKAKIEIGRGGGRGLLV